MLDESSREFVSETQVSKNDRSTINSHLDDKEQSKKNFNHQLCESDSSMIDLNAKDAPTRKFMVN